MKTHIYLGALTISLALGIAPSAFGAEISYTDVRERIGDQVLVRQSGFTTENWYKCFISTRACEGVASSTTLAGAPLVDGSTRSVSPAGTNTLITSYPAPSYQVVRQLFSRTPDGATSLIATLPSFPETKRTLWTSDANALLFITGGNEVKKYDISTNTVSTGGTLPPGASWLSVSPNGRYVAFYIPATQTRGTRTFGILDTVNQSIHTKVETLGYWDLLTEGIRIFAFSPDSTSLIYIDDIKNQPTLYRVTLSSLKAGGGTFISQRMFSREYAVTDVFWKDAGTIFFTANRDNPYQYSLYEYVLKSGALKKIADNVSYATPLQKVGNVYLFAEATETGIRPKIYDPKTKALQTLSVPAGNAQTSKGKVVKLKSGLSGVFLLESSKHSDTLLVWLHGGPYRQTSVGYHPYMSYGGYDWILENARSSNVGVLKLDYPGSAGFGRLFAESISGKVGVKDALDTKSAIKDFAARNGYKNIYVMGNSYGGYLALKLLTDTPTMYKGAISINGVADWLTLLSNLNNSIFNVQFGGPVGEENYALHADASIYNGIANLTTQKVILAHGDKDMTIPYSESKGLSIALELIHKDVTLLTFAGEDHVYKKPESFETLCKATLQLLAVTDTTKCEL
ncbi:MAG: prolyl oligopeptidase family serine peptidase [Patescibacteria group bacterium]